MWLTDTTFFHAIDYSTNEKSNDKQHTEREKVLGGFTPRKRSRKKVSDALAGERHAFQPIPSCPQTTKLTTNNGNNGSNDNNDNNNKRLSLQPGHVYGNRFEFESLEKESDVCGRAILLQHNKVLSNGEILSR